LKPKFSTISDSAEIERIKSLNTSISNKRVGRKPSPISLALMSGDVIAVDISSMDDKRLHAFKSVLRSPTGYVARRGLRIRTRTEPDRSTLYVWTVNADGSSR